MYYSISWRPRNIPNITPHWPPENAHQVSKYHIDLLTLLLSPSQRVPEATHCVSSMGIFVHLPASAHCVSRTELKATSHLLLCLPSLLPDVGNLQKGSHQRESHQNVFSSSLPPQCPQQTGRPQRAVLKMWAAEPPRFPRLLLRPKRWKLFSLQH